MHEGLITFVSGKGWFFAESLADHSAVFIHQNNVENHRYLKVDDRVQFDLAPSSHTQGKIDAVNVKYISHSIARQTSGVQS